MSEVAKERTGWRDLRLSQRHRRWGLDVPATDIDFLLAEYDQAKVAALVEYKHEYATPQYASRPSYQALIDLANRASLPFFAVRYADDWSWWRVVPLNAKAKEYLPEPTQMTEKEWVTLLYRVRGRRLPENLFADAMVEI